METHVKVLQLVTVFCQKGTCEKPATHLFRTGTLAAYCKSHANAEAARIGIELPIAGTNMPRTGTFSARSVVDRLLL
jgi:hypothetical protein